MEEKKKTSLYPRYKDYIQNYAKENYKQYNFKVSRHNDPDLIDFLDAKKDKSPYIRNLIKKDMRSQERKERKEKSRTDSSME